MKNYNLAEESNSKLPGLGCKPDAEITGSPVSYGKSRVVLLPVAPKMVHVFWDINAGSREKLKQQSGNGRQAVSILRFYEGTGTAGKDATDHAFFDVVIDLHRQNNYVHLLDPGQSYQVEIGFKTQDGQFFPAARSNVAEMPRVRPVPETVNRNVAVAADTEKIFSSAKIDKESFGDHPITAGEAKATKKVEKNPEISETEKRFDETILAQPTDQAEILKRRAVIFKYLQKTTVSRATGTTSPPGLHGLVEGERYFDLTAMSEKKFIAGISSW